MTTWPQRENDLLLPPRTRLFHVGPHKTGTTALQRAAASRREQLLEHGVRYPGWMLNHRTAIRSFAGQRLGWAVEGGTPPRPPSAWHWRALLHEIEHDRERRILFGHEYASGASDEDLARWAEELGPRLHVVITLRSYGRMLPSLWQESLKRTAGRRGFDRWLRAVLLADNSGASPRPRRLDPSGLITRWANTIGPRNVTVIALSPRDHAFMFHAFEDLLGLPRDLLASVNPVDLAVNRSLSVPEAELFRRLNLETRKLGLEFDNHEWLNYHGGITRVTALRTPNAGEATLRLPDWAVDLAQAEEQRVVATIAQAGVNLVGQADDLRTGSRPKAEPYVDHRKVEAVPIDLAVTALVGVIAGATGREAPSFERTAASLVRKLRTDARHNLPPLVARTGARLADEALIRFRRVTKAVRTRVERR